MANGQQMVDTLAGLMLFADLSRPELEAAAHLLEEDMFAQGQRILRQGFTGSNFYVIVDGEAAVTIGGTTRTKLSRGDFFGEVSILLGEPPTADIVALTPLRCMTLSGPAAKEFLLANPKVMFRVLQAEARRLRTTLQWLG